MGSRRTKPNALTRWKPTPSFVLCIIGLGGTVSAQNSGNPEILHALQVVQTTLNSTVTTLNAIDSSMALGNTLFTPMVVQVSLEIVSCSAVNVSAADRLIGSV